MGTPIRDYPLYAGRGFLVQAAEGATKQRGRGDEGGGGGDESREKHGVLNVFLRPARKNIDLKLP